MASFKPTQPHGERGWTLNVAHLMIMVSYQIFCSKFWHLTSQTQFDLTHLLVYKGHNALISE